MVECIRGGDCESSPGRGRPPRREFSISLDEEEVFGGANKLALQDKMGRLVDFDEGEMTGQWAIDQRCEPRRAKTHHLSGGQPLTPIPHQKATA
jgi:hypothetical protein